MILTLKALLVGTSAITVLVWSSANDASGVGIYFLVGAIMAMAATVASTLGFGFNLLAAPLMVSFCDPRSVVPALHMAWVPIGLALCIHNRRHIRLPRIGWWLAFAVPGLIAGVWLLDNLDRVAMSRITGAVTILTTLLLACKWQFPIKHERPWMLGAGAFSGLLGGSTAMSGPPLVLLGLNQKWETVQFRANLLVYFTCLSAVCVGIFGWREMLTLQSLRYASAGAPGLIVGFFVGTYLARYVVGRSYRYAALALLFAAGVMPWLN